MNYDECINNKDTKKILSLYLSSITPIKYTSESER